MGYIFMAISLLMGQLKGFFGKKISGLVSTVKGTFYVNMLRMLVCVAVGFVIALTNGFSIFKTDLSTLMIMAVSGISMAIFMASWIFCVRKGAYVMLSVFLLLGGGLTMGLCNLFFNESISENQLIGFILLVIASCIMVSYSSNIKGTFSVSSFLTLVLCGTFSGLTDFSQKWFIYSQPSGSVWVFNFYTYVFAFIVLAVSFVIANKNENAENDGKSFRVFFVVCLMAISLFAYSYFRTMAAKYVPAAILYPFSSGAALVLSALMAVVFFKERITRKCVVGIIITLCAIVIMNL